MKVAELAWLHLWVDIHTTAPDRMCGARILPDPAPLTNSTAWWLCQLHVTMLPQISILSRPTDTWQYSQKSLQTSCDWKFLPVHMCFWWQAYYILISYLLTFCGTVQIIGNSTKTSKLIILSSLRTKIYSSVIVPLVVFGYIKGRT